MAKVIRVGSGSLAAIKKAVEELDAAKLRIGVFESARYKDGTPVAGVAAVQELGSPKMGIPPRPFFRTTAEEKKGEWANLFGKGAEAVFEGKISAVNALEQIGLVAAGQVKTKISQITAPPLSPVTLHLRKLKQQGGEDFKVTGKLVGELKQRVAKGESLDVSGVSTKPLVDDKIMINSITHKVET